MKLKYNFAIQEVTDFWAAVPVGKDARRYRGVMSLNESAKDMMELLREDITEEQRDQIIANITQNEVAVNVHFIPLPMLTLFRDLGYRIDDYPQAFDNYSHEISLPCYPQLTSEQVRFVAKTVIEAYHSVVKRS